MARQVPVRARADLTCVYCQVYQADQQMARQVPVRARGDLKWPPTPYRKPAGDDQPAPRLETPRLPKKDYTRE